MRLAFCLVQAFLNNERNWPIPPGSLCEYPDARLRLADRETRYYILSEQTGFSARLQRVDLFMLQAQHCYEILTTCTVTLLD